MRPKIRGLFKPKAKAAQSAAALTAASTDGSPTSPEVRSPDELFEEAQNLQQQGQLEKAIKMYGSVIEGMPQRAEPYYKRANALNGLGRAEEALRDYDQAICLNPSYAYAWCNRGSVLERLGRREEALANYDRALALDPKDPLTHYNRGSVLKDLKRFEEALASYEAAIGFNADFAEAYVNRGNVLQELKRHEAAVESFGRAIALKPVIAEAFQGRGVSLRTLKRFDRALEDYNKAIELDPAAKYLVGVRREVKMQVCRWDGFREDLDLIAKGVGEGKPVCTPLALTALTDSLSLLRSAAQIWMRDQICDQRDMDLDLQRIAEGSRASASMPGSSKIRIGYFSADFRTHPVAYLSAGLFERHDRTKFEVTAFAFGPEASDPMLARLTNAFDHFIDVRQKSDLDVAALARDRQLDIAVDLNGFTEHCRTKIFAARAAPIQINFLGYPGTMGAEFMDYLIADGTVVPRAHQSHYAEKIIYLPGSFLPFDSSYAIADRTFTREELGLPPRGFVFCCFNNSYKITPEVFDGWMRILSRTENAVLWLQQADAAVSANLRREALRRGVDGRRLVFADRTATLPDHLARLRAADLFIDTFPYNAHATALDALWAGLPLLTYAGESFASRVAASLLCTAGLPELIARSPSEYEEKAIDLAANPARLARLRQALKQRDTSLFDTERYMRNLEAAYAAIHERYRSGLGPEHVNEHLALSR
jgi:predicted O-linked N-acetylglucosamine transferase (SPINDLY family)